MNSRNDPLEVLFCFGAGIEPRALSMLGSALPLTCISSSQFYVPPVYLFCGINCFQPLVIMNRIAVCILVCCWVDLPYFLEYL